MARRVKNQSDADNKAAVELSEKISRVVLHIIRARGLTQSRVAQELGYTRSSFCQMLNSREVARLWRLPALCGLCRVLGIQIDELIATAYRGAEQEDLGEATLWVATVGTEPRSTERLQEIIFEVTGRNAEQSGVRLFEIGCKDFVADYRAGKLSDRDAFRILRQAEDERCVEKVETARLPLWAALAEMYGAEAR